MGSEATRTGRIGITESFLLSYSCLLRVRWCTRKSSHGRIHWRSSERRRYLPKRRPLERTWTMDPQHRPWWKLQYEVALQSTCMALNSVFAICVYTYKVSGFVKL